MKTVTELSPSDAPLMCHGRSIACPHCNSALSEQEIRSILGQFARSERFGSVRGNRFAKMTPEQRSLEARRAVQARWAQRKGLKSR